MVIDGWAVVSVVLLVGAVLGFGEFLNMTRGDRYTGFQDKNGTAILLGDSVLTEAGEVCIVRRLKSGQIWVESCGPLANWYYRVEVYRI